MLDFLRKITKPKYQPFNQIEIYQENLIWNFNYLQSLEPQAEIWPVLKSNAYGHGIKEVCQILNKTNCKKVCVDSYPEAQIVYKNFKQKVLILSEMPYEVYRYCKFKKTEFVVYNFETIKFLSGLSKKIKIHLFINTGINREGASDDFDSLIRLIDLIKNSKNIKLVGVCSHLASADIESELNKIQEQKFWQAVKIFKEQGIDPKYLHLGNSAGIFVINNNFNSFRPGIAFYGYNPFTSLHNAFLSAQNLKPALSIKSTIISAYNAKKGQKTSYNETYELEKDSNLAVIPFGYYEGLNRKLSNIASFKIISKTSGNFYAKIAGLVCMNLTVLDCEDHKINIGDRVEIISANKNDPNSVENIAKISETIPYEVLIKIQSNIRRVVV